MNNSEIKEMITWLLLEYRSGKSVLNTKGMAMLIELREKWNIEKADKAFAEFCKGE